MPGQILKMMQPNRMHLLPRQMIYMYIYLLLYIIINIILHSNKRLIGNYVNTYTHTHICMCTYILIYVYFI